MTKDKILKIAELHKQIKQLVYELNFEEMVSDNGVDWVCLDMFSFGGREDVYNMAKILGVEVKKKEFDIDKKYEYRYKTYFVYDGLEFYCLNKTEEGEG